MRLAGLTIVVTGAGQGLGRAFARAFAAEGARIVIAELKPETGSSATEEVLASGGEAIFVQTDVTSVASADAMVARAIEAFGRLDVLVNNAAIYDGLHVAPLERLTTGEWDAVLAVNVRGTWNCARAVVPTMRRQGGGKIINLGSSSSLAGTPHMLHYVASKGAIEAMTRAMAVELGPSGITVNALVPGLTDSGATKRWDLPEGTDRPPIRPAIARPLTPDGLARAAVFLASADSDPMTGQSLVVNAGSAFG
jgi:NAD(P)-dependent dehydrogenase (short-subunit alcohol dehydrogenase family)